MDSRSPYPLRRMELMLRAILDKAPALINLIPVNTSSGPAAELTGAVPGLPVRSLTAAITPVQSGSGDPSPENVRPISGWTGANIYATGVNIWDETWEVGSINNTTGANTTDNSNIRAAGYISVKPGTSLFCYIGVDKNLRLHWYDAEKTQISSETAKNSVVTVPTGAEYLRIRTTQTYGNTYNNDISINALSTDTAYHPYVGTVYPVSWESEAGTVYGSTVNVTTGVLTVTHGVITFDGSSDEGWSKSTYNYFTTTKISGAKDENAKAENFQSNLYAYGNIANNNQNVGGCLIWGSVRVRLPDMTLSIDDWKASLLAQNLNVVYPLAEPQVYQLTATEVRTLTEGPTVVRADTGDVSVTYHVHA